MQGAATAPYLALVASVLQCCLGSCSTAASDCIIYANCVSAASQLIVANAKKKAQKRKLDLHKTLSTLSFHDLPPVYRQLGLSFMLSNRFSSNRIRVSVVPASTALLLPALGTWSLLVRLPRKSRLLLLQPRMLLCTDLIGMLTGADRAGARRSPNLRLAKHRLRDDNF